MAVKRPPVQPGEKFCIGCLTVKPLNSDIWWKSTSHLDGWYIYCIDCAKLIHRGIDPVGIAKRKAKRTAVQQKQKARKEILRKERENRKGKTKCNVCKAWKPRTTEHFKNVIKIWKRTCLECLGPIAEKPCSICGEPWPRTADYYYKISSQGHLRPECILCTCAIKAKRDREKNPLQRSRTLDRAHKKVGLTLASPLVRFAQLLKLRLELFKLAGWKQCSQCRQFLNTKQGAFHRNITEPDGWAYVCKQCRKVRTPTTSPRRE